MKHEDGGRYYASDHRRSDAALGDRSYYGNDRAGHGL